MVEYKSKTVIVNSTAKTIFDKAVDMSGLLAAIPEDKRQNVTVDGDMIGIDYAGFSIKIKISEKVPFSKVVYADAEAPFHFNVTIDMQPAQIITQTLLTVTVDADLNLMMKMMLGNKIKEYLDMAVTAVSTGDYLK